MIQMLPSASAAALDTWPSVHPFGMCGQDGSTTNFGTSTLVAGRGGAAEGRREPAIVNANNTVKTTPALIDNKSWRAFLSAPEQSRDARARFRFPSLMILLFGCSSKRTDYF